MKKLFKVITVMLSAALIFAASACGGDKDEWDGVQVLDNSFADTAQAESGIINPPTVVCDISTQDAYKQVVNNELKPASVILRLNENFNVTDSHGKYLCSFSSLYENTLKNKIIPIIYVSDEAGAQRTVKLFTERYDLLDAAVMSDNPSYVKTVRETCQKIRGIVEFKELNDIHDAVRLTNANKASVAVIPQNLATSENVFYLQSRFRTVWVRPDDCEKVNLYQSINSGAYGIVSDDYASVVNVLGDYDEYSTTRTPFVVAHRGLPETHNENSVSGAKAAIEVGATHLEIDGYLTLDKRIAIMHDYTIDRTSDGEGVIENFTLEALQKFQLDKCMPYEPIPSLDDIFETMKGTDIVLLFEIKSQKAEIVQALKTALEKHDMWRQVVVITSHTKILSAMESVLPEIPTANLLAISEDTLEDAFLVFGTLNTCADAPYDGVTPELNAVLRDRGYIGWYWTYDSVTDMQDALSLGFTGLTTNVADEFVKNDSTKYVCVKGDGGVATKPVVGAEMPVIGVTYDKTQENIKGKVFYVEDLGDKYAVIASYKTGAGENSPTLYTQIYYVNK